MKSMNIIYRGRIKPSDEDRIFSIPVVGEKASLNVPASANYVVVQTTPYNKFHVYYQKWLQGKDGPELGLGLQEFPSDLQTIVIKELKKN